MSEILTVLRDRAEEFNTHYLLVVSLEDQIFSGADISIGSIRVSVRHVLTMKSGLIVHLYNIVESIMSRVNRAVGNAVGTVPPRKWSQNARREWLREHGVARIEGGPDKRLDQFESFSNSLLADEPLGPQRLRKPSGSWTDKKMCEFAKRLGVEIPITPDLHRKLSTRDELGEKGPLVFLADRRNDLAHGTRTFEDGCQELTLRQIREIADVVLEFVELVAISFEAYIDNRQFVATA
jgi:hypothetical protein